MGARRLQPYSSVIILCSCRFFQVERSDRAGLVRKKPCSSSPSVIILSSSRFKWRVVVRERASFRSVARK